MTAPSKNEALIDRLDALHSDMTPGRFEHIEMDGAAFTIRDAISALRASPAQSDPAKGAEVVGNIETLERYEQFTDGWGDEVLGLKQHPKGTYVKFDDVAALTSPAPSQLEHTGWSDEAVEAAARAIYETDDAWSAAFPFNAIAEFDKNTYRVFARAALTAASSIAPATVVEDAPKKGLAAARKKFERMMHSKGWMGRGFVSIQGINGRPQLTATEIVTEIVNAYLAASSISPSVAKESGEPS